MKWHIECKFSGKGQDVEGSFDDALREAEKQCRGADSRWVVWAEPANVRMAEVSSDGVCWLKSRLTGEEVKRLMRRHKKTIAGLSFAMGITQKRVRQVRERGLEDSNAVRDWTQFITGQDPGPLPERNRISRRDEETDCGYCGCPLFIGDHAFEYVSAIFCSVTCCRRSRTFA